MVELRDNLIRVAAVCFAALEDLDAFDRGEGWLPTMAISLRLEDDVRDAVGRFYEAQDGFRHRPIPEWLTLIATAVGEGEGRWVLGFSQTS